ncbi:MAG: aminotransferase class I/II-fold pyridoxal phosphate-dependent enzyme, partial [Fusobacterium mortiferum]
VREYLKENIPELTCDIPDGCYFAWIDFSKLNISNEIFQKALIDIGKVAIMPGVTYGEEGKNYLRLNIGCPREKVKDGLSRLKLAVESFKK